MRVQLFKHFAIYRYNRPALVRYIGEIAVHEFKTIFQDVLNGTFSYCVISLYNSSEKVEMPKIL